MTNPEKTTHLYYKNPGEKQWQQFTLQAKKHPGMHPFAEQLELDADTQELTENTFIKNLEHTDGIVYGAYFHPDGKESINGIPVKLIGKAKAS